VVIDKGVIRADCKLEQFRKSVRKVILAFKDSVPQQVDIDGLLHCRRSEEELVLILVNTDDDKIAELAKSTRAERYHIVNMNLEDQFIEYTAPPGRGKLFKWEEI
jgi:acetolactate synthase small subunit